MTHHDRNTCLRITLKVFKNINSTLIHFDTYYNLFIIKLNLLTKLDIYYMGNDKISAWRREKVLETNISCMQEREAFLAIKHLIFVTLFGQQINLLFMNLFGLVTYKNWMDVLANIMGQFRYVFHVHSFINQPKITSSRTIYYLFIYFENHNNILSKNDYINYNII